MSDRWSPPARLALVDQLSQRAGADGESLFDAHGLGVAYRKPGPKSSKKARINSALHAAELRGDVDSVLDAVQIFLSPDLAVEAGTAVEEPTLQPKASSLPSPAHLDEARVLQAVWDLFFAQKRWPTFGEVDRLVDRTHGLELVSATAAMPADLMQPPRLQWLQVTEPLRLTVAGAAACEGSAEDLRIFLDAVRVAAQIEREYEPEAEPGHWPTLTPGDLRAKVALPAAGRDDTLTRVGQLLMVEHWGWSSAGTSADDPADWQFTIDRAVRRLRGVIDLGDYWRITRADSYAPATPAEATMPITPQTIFLVHGHDDARHEIARFLDQVMTTARVVVLNEQASRGRTVIEKFEDHGGEASFAVVLLTPDDVGRALTAASDQPRARQNVVFELGYFYGRLGRDRVVVLNKGGVEKPSDVAGVVYIEYPTGNWKTELAKELTAAGLAVDLSMAT